MTRIAATTAAALITLAALTACSSDQKPSQADGLYAAAVAQADPDHFKGVPAKDLAATGHDICKQLQAGASIKDAIDKTATGFGPAQAAVLVGAAPAALCPDQQDKLKTAG